LGVDVDTRVVTLCYGFVWDCNQ